MNMGCSGSNDADPERPPDGSKCQGDQDNLSTAFGASKPKLCDKEVSDEAVEELGKESRKGGKQMPTKASGKTTVKADSTMFAVPPCGSSMPAKGASRMSILTKVCQNYVTTGNTVTTKTKERKTNENKDNVCECESSECCTSVECNSEKRKSDDVKSEDDEGKANCTPLLEGVGSGVEDVISAASDDDDTKAENPGPNPNPVSAGVKPPKSFKVPAQPKTVKKTKQSSALKVKQSKVPKFKYNKSKSAPKPTSANVKTKAKPASAQANGKIGLKKRESETVRKKKLLAKLSQSMKGQAGGKSKPKKSRKKEKSKSKGK